MLRSSVILLLAVIGAPAVPVVAQVTKPRTTAYRLPKPTSVAASQQPDGTILVVWSAVPEAASYKLFRSVPPDPMTRMDLPSPGDTQYVDTDVKAGSTYYYLVTAVNEAGSEGLRAGTSPVTVSGASGTLAAGGDTDIEPGGGGTAPATVSAPTNVLARPYPYMDTFVYWKTTDSTARFLVERLDDDDDPKSAWKQIPASGDGLWACCSARDHEPPPGVDLVYRVTAIKGVNLRSAPTTSNSIVNWPIETAPYLLHAEGMVVGESRQIGAGGRNIAWASLDTFVVSLWSPGVIKAKQHGRTYVVRTGLNDRGAVQTWIWRIDVQPRPQ